MYIIHTINSHYIIMFSNAIDGIAASLSSMVALMLSTNVKQSFLSAAMCGRIDMH